MTESVSPLLLAVLMVAAFVLIFGGLRLMRTGNRPKGALMIACAAVMIGNVLIWTI